MRTQFSPELSILSLQGELKTETKVVDSQSIMYKV